MAKHKPKSNSFSLDKVLRSKEEYFFLAISSLLLVIIFRDFIFLGKAYIFNDIGSDTITLFYPQYVHTNGFIREWGIHFWSFYQGLGQNAFTNVIVDPFNVIYLIFDKSSIPSLVIYVEIIKILASGFVFCKYLKLLKLSPTFILIGGLLFSFSSYLIIGGSWYIFSTQAFYLVFLAYSFEKFFTEKKFYYLPISFALIAANESFGLFAYSIFIFIYFNIRYIETEKFSTKRYFRKLLQLVLLAVLGVGLTSIFFLNKLHLMLNSPRGGGEASLADELINYPIFFTESSVHYLTEFTRLLSGDLLGSGSNYKGWGNYLEAPMYYCGLLTIISLPLLFYIKSKKIKFTYISVLTIFLIVLIFPYFRYAFWVFTGEYFRIFALLIVFYLVYIFLRAIDSFNKLKSIQKLFPVLTIFILGLILLITQAESIVKFNSSVMTVVLAFMIIYAVIYTISTKLNIEYIKLILLIAVFAELALMSSFSTSDRISFDVDYFKRKIDYNDFNQESVDYIKQNDKSPFYRVESDYLPRFTMQYGLNTPMVQGYYGTTSYNSFNNRYYVDFLSSLKIINPGKEHQTRWLVGFIGRPPLQYMMGVKYILSRNDENIDRYEKFGYRLQKRVNNISILKNDNAIQLGFTSDSILSLTNFKNLDFVNKLFVLTNSAVLDDNIIEEGDIKLPIVKAAKNHVNIPNNVFMNSLMSMSEEQFVVTDFSHSRITGKIELSSSKILTFSIPYDVGWKININGEEELPIRVNIGFLGCHLNKGIHNIVLEYTPPYFYSGLIISIISILVFVVIVLIPIVNKRKV
jgi:uncharacterized membrane protein YfhO